jgi:hypothetical protein
MRNALVLVLFLVGCGGGKTDPGDTFTGIADEKSDAFSSRMKIVTTLPDASGSVTIDYSKSPRYRAVKFHALAGDFLKLTVAATAKTKPAAGSTSGADPVAWLLDARFRTVAANDDVSDKSSDSQILVQVRRSGTYYLVMRDYNLATTVFVATLAVARVTGDPVADANAWFQLFVVGDDYGVIEPQFQVSMDQMPQAAQDEANGFYKTDVGGATGYAFPYGDSVMYFLTGGSDGEAVDATPYDADGNAISPTALGGDRGDIVFATPAQVHDAAAADAARLGFQQYYKCGDDNDVKSLGEKGSMGACMAACQAEPQAAGCWYLDGTGGFARDCRVCLTLTPVQMTWANDWARPLP